MRILVLASLLVGCMADPPSSDLVLPAGAFTVQHGIAVAPLTLPAGTTVRAAVIDLGCPDAPHALVLACLRAADPLDSSSAQAYCTGALECGLAPLSLAVPMPPVVVQPRRVVELVVASSVLPSVGIGGAVVTVE